MRCLTRSKSCGRSAPAPAFFAPSARLRHYVRRFASSPALPQNSASMPSEFSPRARIAFQRRLLIWFRTHCRELPWRASRDPYRVWVAEIMLQQTRIAAVLPYYHRFLKQFPDCSIRCAASREEKVLRLWSGLGYYSRARNLHRAAREIVAHHDGEFPRSFEAALALPGIGAYTAAAVLSIAYDLPHRGARRQRRARPRAPRRRARRSARATPLATAWRASQTRFSPRRDPAIGIRRSWNLAKPFARRSPALRSVPGFALVPAYARELNARRFPRLAANALQ